MNDYNGEIIYGDGLARFRAAFDSECDNCFADIYHGDDMAFDKVESEYICDECADERAFEREEDEEDDGVW